MRALFKAIRKFIRTVLLLFVLLIFVVEVLDSTSADYTYAPVGQSQKQVASASAEDDEAQSPAGETQTETLQNAQTLVSVNPDDPAEESEPDRDLPQESSFRIRFLDVGEGDSALVFCDGHTMIIDGGNSSASQLVYTVLKEEGVDYLDYLVATHMDGDHIGGLSAALQYADVGVAYGIGEARDSRAYTSLISKLQERGKELTVPDAGDTFDLGSAVVTVLAPEKGQTYSDNTSVALRICYGETSFLFTGDCELEDEEYMLSSDTELASDVIKIGHHGSSSSTSQAFFDAVSPGYAVISVGKDNGYGHPVQEVLDRISEGGCELYRTDLQGDISCVSDGETITFTTENTTQQNVFLNTEEVGTRDLDASGGSDSDGTTSGSYAYSYLANLNSYVFHVPGCHAGESMNLENRWEFSGTRDELIGQGFRPCEICNP